MSRRNSYTYRLVSRHETTLLPSAWRHCVHVMIYSELPKGTKLFNKIPISHTVMMQMRSDGRFGFPGGFVDETDISLEDALYRELNEEMGNLPKQFKINTSDYIMSHLLEEKRYCLHFYGKEVPFNQYLEIEKRDWKQIDTSFEVFGVIRVPLFVMFDERGGFPAFMRNNFLGNCKDQLITGLRVRNILDEETLQLYLKLWLFSDALSTCGTSTENPEELNAKESFSNFSKSASIPVIHNEEGLSVLKENTLENMYTNELNNEIEKNNSPEESESQMLNL